MSYVVYSDQFSRKGAIWTRPLTLEEAKKELAQKKKDNPNLDWGICDPAELGKQWKEGLGWVNI